MNLIHTIVGLALNGSLLLLSFIVPKRKDAWLLGGGLGRRFSGNTRYFFLHLISLGEEINHRDVRWITKSKAVVRQLNERGMPVVSGGSLQGFWAILRAEVLFIESGTALGIAGHDIGYERLFFGRFKVVQLWHGSPMKHICLDAMQEARDAGLMGKLKYGLQKAELSSLYRIVAQSDYDAKILSQAFANDRVVTFGSARNDIFYHPELQWEDVEQKLNLSSYKKVILYAPTFRDVSTGIVPLDDAAFLKLDKLLQQRGWLFLVKKHPYDRFLNVPPGAEAIRDVTADIEDIQSLLSSVDVLVTDYSSVCFDYAHLKRPIVYYIYDLEEYMASSRPFYLDIQQDMPGPFARTADEFINLISSLEQWSSTDEYQKQMDEFLCTYQKYPGEGACERLRQEIEHALS